MAMHTTARPFAARRINPRLGIFFSIFGVAISFKTLPVTEVLLVLSVAAMILASLSAGRTMRGGPHDVYMGRRSN